MTDTLGSTDLDTSLNLIEGECGVQERIVSTEPCNKESKAKEGPSLDKRRTNLGRSKNSIKLSGPVFLFFLPDGK